MRFVEIKTSAQQARAVLFRARERLVAQRTELAGALRSALYEYGKVIPSGLAHLKRVELIVDDPQSDIPDLVRDECRDLLVQIGEKTARIEDKTRQLTELSQEEGITAEQCSTADVSLKVFAI